MGLSSAFETLKVSLFNRYSHDPGKILVHTGVLGWILSSLAQVSAVVFNNKISPDQKSFLIPQEIADATVNILSFFLVTSSFTALGKKLVSTGKLRTPHIDKFLRSHGLFEKSAQNPNVVGDFKFNIEKLPIYADENLKKDYKNFKNGVGVITGTVGSILSCNIITPILRNNIAAHQQKEILARKQQMTTPQLRAPKGISIQQYQNMAYRQHSGALKV
ncbi:MAG: hypothetical protein LKG27_05860 [Clostridiaceae bacterium]|jgi:hypothetical protein|nr:hypothetical protein [Clostridiaceae bacterium]